MRLESTIAFRKLISDSLQYIWKSGDSQQDILAMMDRLEKVVTKLINYEADYFLSGVLARYKMNVVARVDFGVLMAEGLKYMTHPDRKAEDILLVLDRIQAWVQKQIDQEVTQRIGKPQLSFERLGKKTSFN
jgi:hypothetical protein